MGQHKQRTTHTLKLGSNFLISHPPARGIVTKNSNEINSFPWASGREQPPPEHKIIYASLENVPHPLVPKLEEL